MSALIAQPSAAAPTSPSSSSMTMRWAASASWRVLGLGERVEVEPVEGARRSRGSCRCSRGPPRRGPRGTGTGRAGSAGPSRSCATREEELERLDQVHGADGHVVVPLAPVVVDLDRVEAAVLVHELQRVGRAPPWRTASGRGRRRCRCRRARSSSMPRSVRAAVEKLDVGARLLGLVLDGDPDVRVHLGDAAHAVELEPPELARSRPGRGSRSRPGPARASRSGRRAAWRRRRPPRRRRARGGARPGSGLVNAPPVNSRM